MNNPATDLLGDPVSLKPADGKTRYPRPEGYYYPPGTGPAGETCSSCEHCRGKILSQRRVYKCALNRANWGGTRRTDILLRSPACKFWKANQPTETRTT